MKVLESHDHPLRSMLVEICGRGHIETPDKFDGDDTNYFYEVNCSVEDAERITDLLFDLEASSVPVDGISTSETYKYARLVNIWSELTEYLTKRE